MNAIKTVKSLTGEEFELTTYKKGLIEAFQIACKYGIWAGAGIGKYYLINLIYNNQLSLWNRFDLLYSLFGLLD